MLLVVRLPSSLQTVIGWIDKSIPNNEDPRLLHRFVNFMHGTDTSEKYQRVHLIIALLFVKFHSPSKRVSDIDKQQDIIGFLDTLKKHKAVDPDMKWIRT